MAPPVGPSLDTSLAEVTFVVLDLETTGVSPALDRITEIGALKLRGGERLGGIDTLVNPGVPIPPVITMLTGITQAMVLPAPRVHELLPTLLEFLDGAVIVGHNIRFDCAFLDAACIAHGYDTLPHLRVDTVGIARRLARGDVPDLRLQTLAQHYRTTTDPVHRVYADAAATAELFHTLLEHAATWGVFGLDDLVAFPRIRAHKTSGKLALTGALPRAPGVYLLRDRRGEVLLVGKAANLRSRVRAYFSGADRRKVPHVVELTARVEHIECAHALEASVRELRMIERYRPRFNKPSRARRRNIYLKLNGRRAAPVTVVRHVGPGDVALGPFSSFESARLARIAVARALPALARDSGASTEDHDRAALLGRRAIDSQPGLLLDRLGPSLERDALARAFRRSHAVRRLRSTGDVQFETPRGRVVLRDGRLVLPDDEGCDMAPHVVDDEVLIVARWLARHLPSRRQGVPPRFERCCCSGREHDFGCRSGGHGDVD